MDAIQNGPDSTYQRPLKKRKIGTERVIAPALLAIPKLEPTLRCNHDPLMTTAVRLEGLTTMYCYTVPLRFSIDTSQFFTITRDAYTFMTRDEQFRNKVSCSMFEYYCVMLLWKRVLYVLSEFKTEGNKSKEFVSRLPLMYIPEPIRYYLDGIGNILDFSGRAANLKLFLKLAKNAVSGLQGHYGPVTRVNHVAYETMPAPFVVAYRMCYEYAFTLSQIPDHPREIPEDLEQDQEPRQEPEPWPEDWDLPEELRPTEQGLRPNRNLLGWNRARTLTTDMMFELANYVTVNNSTQTILVQGVRHVRHIPIFYDLLEHISVLLDTTKALPAIEMSNSVETFKGSVAQVLFMSRLESDMDNDRSGFRLEPLPARLLQLQTHCTTYSSITSAAAIFRYRIQRFYPETPSSDCLSYTDENGIPPQGWLGNANRVFNTIPQWNSYNFYGSSTTGANASERYIFNLRRLYGTGTTEQGTEV